MSKKVSLDPYRTRGVMVFSGEARGEIVAEAIIKKYGKDVEITIPDDVYAITHTFKRGFNSQFKERKL